MRTLAILLVLLLSSSVSAQGQRVNGTLRHNERTRSYILYVPSSYHAAEAAPLVLNFHGLTGSSFQQETSSRMNAVAEREGFLVAYPNAVGGDWSNSVDHNIGYTQALLDTIQSAYAVDSQRVYATGFSQGGIMSYTLGAALPDRFAAIAPVSGTRLLSGETNRRPSFVPNTPERPLPLLHIHGTQDNIVPYEGGTSVFGPSIVFPSVATVLEEWVFNNGGQTLQQTAMISSLDLTENPVLALFQCADCGSYRAASGAVLTADVIHLRHGADHTWPTARRSLVASEAIWGFFSGHQLAAAIPEPSSATMLLLAGLLVGSASRHKQRRA